VTHDGEAYSVPDTMTIRTGNTRPVADAGLDQAIRLGSRSSGDGDGATIERANAATLVRLDGSGSFDVDGDLLAFNWSFVSRPADSLAALADAKAVTPTFKADAAGTYVLHLIVNDGIASSDPKHVVVTTGNSAPVARAGADQTVSIGSTVQLDGTASIDSESDPLEFRWSFVSRPAGSTIRLLNANGGRPMFVPDLAGTYVVQLVVNDGAVNSVPSTVTISTSNSRPVANAGAGR
jgi:hypothetical protein